MRASSNNTLQRDDRFRQAPARPARAGGNPPLSAFSPPLPAASLRADADTGRAPPPRPAQRSPP